MPLLTDLSCQGQTVDIGHLDIDAGNCEGFTRSQGLQGRSGTVKGCDRHPPRLRLDAEDSAVDFVVIHNQESFSLQISGCQGQRCRQSFGGNRQLSRETEEKTTALTQLTFDPHPTTHLFAQTTTDRETQACPSIAAGH